MLGHWWQRRWPWTSAAKQPPSEWSRAFAGVDAIGVVLLLYDWLRPGDSAMPAEVWVAGNAGLSLALLAYGVWTRYRALAVAGAGVAFRKLGRMRAACLAGKLARRVRERNGADTGAIRSFAGDDFCDQAVRPWRTRRCPLRRL